MGSIPSFACAWGAQGGYRLRGSARESALELEAVGKHVSAGDPIRAASVGARTRHGLRGRCASGAHHGGEQSCRHHVHVAAVGRVPAPALGITAESRVCRRFAARLEKTTIPEITALAVIRQVHNDSGDLVVEAKIFVGTRIACVVANSRTGGSPTTLCSTRSSACRRE